MSGTYDYWLVLLSVVVSITASFVALNLAARVVASLGRTSQLYWLAGGAISMGTGIWSMHFIGMLGFRLPIPVSYDVTITLLSLLIAIVMAWFALYSVSRGELSLRRLIISGALMGIGIASMHYTGMAAMKMSPPIRYAPWLFSLSILIAVVASIVALWGAFRLRLETIASALWKKVGSALVMGSAIYGMHYVGMAAAIFAPGSICTASPQDINHGWFAGTLGGFTLMFLMITLLVSAFDAYLAEHSATQEESLKRLNANLEKHAQELSSANASLIHEVQARNQAEDELRQAHAVLETRVAERTAELVRSNQSLLELIAERERLSRDLHDHVLQAIYALGMRLEETQRLSPPELAAQLGDIIASLNTVIRDIRGYISGSPPQILSYPQFKAELEKLTEIVDGISSPHFDLDADPSAFAQLTTDEAEQVLHIAREAVSNAMRHSQAAHGKLALRAADGGVMLEIADDGIGFDTNAREMSGSGLRNISSRARQIGARLDIVSTPGSGTRISIHIPKRKATDT